MEMTSLYIATLLLGAYSGFRIFAWNQVKSETKPVFWTSELLNIAEVCKRSPGSPCWPAGKLTRNRTSF
ncbi:MAG: hypothetical protein E6713_12255 [Sporomusaceae bacterium]|nr:hypothetical protein [Sporomusaceae bacterium]